MKTQMPENKGIDNTVKLMQEGYRFILKRSHTFHTNVFKTRLLGEEAICLVGKQVAELFYDTEKFRRKDAAPRRAKKTIFGEGGVQGLDGEDHRNRKAMFMSMMTRDSLQEVRSLVEEEWRKLGNQKEMVVYEEAKKILTKVAAAWTGVPLKAAELEEWTKELSDMYEEAASVGPKHWQGRRSRSKAEDWLKDVVEQVRSGELEVEKDRALYQFSWHRDTNDELLDPHTVAVEVLNLLRPIVAIAVYIDFAVLAIHQYPEEAEKLQQGNEQQLQYFIQEVRRYYPFFPFVVARVDRGFIWNDYRFEEGTLTLLDLYGTNHYPDDWENPDRFHPDRFQSWKGHPFDFIPQGGGEFEIGHRCAGEWMTLEVLKETLTHFVNRVDFDLPEQDLHFSMNKIPSLPKSKVVLSDVRQRF